MVGTTETAEPRPATPAIPAIPEGDRGLVVINANLCKGCSLCVLYCPPAVISMAGGLNPHGYHPATYAGAGCTGCAICFYVCPEPGTISVYRQSGRPEE
jgi:Pyruvate/2-oxoacid:ferredoxin oxidoreductase delta subunit